MTLQISLCSPMGSTATSPFVKSADSRPDAYSGAGLKGLVAVWLQRESTCYCRVGQEPDPVTGLRCMVGVDERVSISVSAIEPNETSVSAEAVHRMPPILGTKKGATIWGLKPAPIWLWQCY